MGQLRERGLPGARDDALQVHQHDEPGERRHEQADHQREDGARVARGRRLEGGHGVGERLDAGHRRGARREGAQHQQHGDALDRLEADDRGGRKAEPGGIDQPHGDQREDGQHEGVGRRGKGRARLAHAAQVAHRQDRDRREAQRNGVVGQAGDGRGDRRDPGGDPLPP